MFVSLGTGSAIPFFNDEEVFGSFAKRPGRQQFFAAPGLAFKLCSASSPARALAHRQRRQRPCPPLFVHSVLESAHSFPLNIPEGNDYETCSGDCISDGVDSVLVNTGSSANETRLWNSIECCNKQTPRSEERRVGKEDRSMV